MARDFLQHVAVLRRHFLPNVHFQCCMLLQGTLGHDFDIFAASGESTAQVLLWKTRSRPIGVRVCRAAQFDFFSTEFDQREWTVVVFWKEDSGRQLRLITPENEGGDETSSHLHQDLPSLMILMFLFVLTHLRRLLDLLDRQIHLDYHKASAQLLHLLVGEEKQELKMYRVSDHDHDLNHRSLD